MKRYGSLLELTEAFPTELDDGNPFSVCSTRGFVCHEFAMTLGSTGFFSFLWETATAQVEQTGEVSAEIVSALLDLQGSRGIYEDPARFEERRCCTVLG